MHLYFVKKGDQEVISMVLLYYLHLIFVNQMLSGNRQKDRCDIFVGNFIISCNIIKYMFSSSSSTHSPTQPVQQ